MIDGLNHARLVLWAARFAGRQDADDVVQQVYLKMLNGEVPPWKGTSKQSTWAFAIVKHTALQWKRHNPLAVGMPTDLVTDVPDYDTTIDTNAAVATLSPTYQTVLRGFAEHGGYTSLAAVLGLTRGQVRGRLYRARRKLRAQR